jgi:hypothetical protein
MRNHPLNEIFGYPYWNHSELAQRHRKYRLCPHNNKVPNCTKDKANDPLGVCSISEGGNIAIVCPIRFHQDWVVVEDAAAFFFPAGTKWTSLIEVRLNDREGSSAGYIDVVLVAYDDHGHVTDFGALEIQAVYISGNIRRLFERYMENPLSRQNIDWNSPHQYYPRPDYLSSSRKRLVPQLIYKGRILKSWGKKQAVAIHTGFYQTLPKMTEVEPEEADVAWLVYDLVLDEEADIYRLKLQRVTYTPFELALDQITTPQPGPVEGFIGYLQERLDRVLSTSGDDQNPPDAPTLSNLLKL